MTTRNFGLPSTFGRSPFPGRDAALRRPRLRALSLSSARKPPSDESYASDFTRDGEPFSLSLGASEEGRGDPPSRASLTLGQAPCAFSSRIHSLIHSFINSLIAQCPPLPLLY